MYLMGPLPLETHLIRKLVSLSLDVCDLSLFTLNGEKSPMGQIEKSLWRVTNRKYPQWRWSHKSRLVDSYYRPTRLHPRTN